MDSINIGNMFVKYIALVLIVALFTACSGNDEVYVIPEQDKREIEALKGSIPLVLAEQGWEAYESLFSENYQNWHMMNDEVRKRDEFLQSVKPLF